MSLFVTSLNSGSNGNCYYIGNEHEAVLIDAGISCREIEKRMKRLGLLMQRVKAVFVSHEHSDHIRGIPVLIKKYAIPVYITPLTLQHSGLTIDNHLAISFNASEPVRFGKLCVTAFPKLHDAIDPYSFMVTGDEIKIGVFTDIGFPCQHLISHFEQCHAAFLEANYDDYMLDNGRYPLYLKRRIRGGRGHLSNEQALTLFKAHRPSFMSHLFLSHLSKNNNCPRLVQELFDSHAGDTEIIVTSRSQETPLYFIRKQGNLPQVLPRRVPDNLQLYFSFGE